MEGSIRLQEDRTMQHSKTNSETVIETIRSVDLLERREIANDLAWKAKWGTRTTELDRKAERCRYLFRSFNCYC
jgi:hypothetical protein